MNQLGRFNVLQLVFLESSGFRFPFAHYTTRKLLASELFLIYGFIVRYVRMDGAQDNRGFN